MLIVRRTCLEQGMHAGSLDGKGFLCLPAPTCLPALDRRGEVIHGHSSEFSVRRLSGVEETITINGRTGGIQQSFQSK